MAPPKKFQDLATAYEAPANSFISVIGIVVDVMPPTVTRTGDHMMTFKLLDERLRDAIYGSQGLSVRFFRKDRAHLPNINRIGDIVLLDNAKMSTWAQQPLALSNYQTRVLAFQAVDVPDPSFEISFAGERRLKCSGTVEDVAKLTLEEQSYVIKLKKAMESTVSALPHTSNGTSEPMNYMSPVQAPTEPLAMRRRSVDSSVQAIQAPAAPLAMRKRPGDELIQNVAKKIRNSSFGQKYRQVSELRHRDFADICVQVVRKFVTRYGACELYVSDYTANNEMWYYPPPEEQHEGEKDGDRYGYTGQKSKFPGPYGFLVLKVNAKDPHASYIDQSINEGDFVLLRNVKMKIMSEGTKLEGDMWPDDLNREKVLVIKLLNHDLPEIRAVLQRKQKYWASRNPGDAEAQEKPLTKKGRKRLRQKQERERLAEEAAARLGGKTNAGAGTSEVNESGAALKGRSKTDLNPHIRCSHEEINLSTVRTVIDPDNDRHTNTHKGHTYLLPFVNANYRAKVRVVDFEPRHLEEFALPELIHDGDHSEDSLVDYDASPKYEWSFSLLLEDAGSGKDNESCAQTWVNLGHNEAQYLFGNDMDDPADLARNARLLAKLREKLCILWGNLEEKKADEAISNRSFECCLQEYGLELDGGDPERKGCILGYKRMYRMFGVTIL